MPQLVLPDKETGLWQGIFDDDTKGSLYQTFNIDLEKSRGKVMLSDKLQRIVDNFETPGPSGLTNLNAEILNFVRTAADGTDRWWAAVNGGRLFKSTNDDPESTWAQDAITNTPTASLYDMVEFNSGLIVAKASDLDRLSTSWTNNWYGALTGASTLSSTAHPLDAFTNLLIVGDGRYVNVVDDSSIAVDPRLTFPPDYNCTWITHDERQVYIGTQNTLRREASVFVWDPTTRGSTYDAYPGVKHWTTLAGIVVKGVLYCLNGLGQILQSNGVGFDVVQQFPFAYEYPTTAPQEMDANSWVSRRGLIPYDNGFLINVRGENDYKRVPGGLWYFDVDTKNLYQRFSFGNLTGSVDFGQYELNLIGALARTSKGQGSFLASGSYYQVYTGTTRHAIFTSTERASASQRGHFFSPKLSTEKARVFWRRLQAKWKRFENTTDRVIIWFKDEPDVVDVEPDIYTITWASTTTFTATLRTGRAVGDCVIVKSGKGAGTVLRISALSATPDGGTSITVTIDEAVGDGSSAAQASIDNFVRLGTISDDAIDQKFYNIIKRTKWIQFLVELRGTDTSPEFEKLLVDLEYSKR